MKESDYSSYSFHLPFESKGEEGYVSVHLEMTEAVQGLSPTGRYFIYCLHPQDGSFTFYIEKDESGSWISECLPPFVDNDFICFITDRIGSKEKQDE